MNSNYCVPLPNPSVACTATRGVTDADDSLDCCGISAARQMPVGGDMWTEQQLNKISEQIIGAALTVHRRIGPGCLESAYSPCFGLELQRLGLDFQREVALALHYDELVIPRAYIADYKIGGCVVAELKAQAMLTVRDWQQMQTYLRLDGSPLGLIINFGAPRLVDGIKRIVNNFPAGTGENT